MATQKKRSTLSISDVVGDIPQTSSAAKFKSGYSGPKKSTSSVMERFNAENGGRDLYAQKRAEDLTKEEVKRRERAAERGARISGNVRNSSRSRSESMENTFSAPSISGLVDYAWILYVLMLIICLVTAVSSYSSHVKRTNAYTYPSYIFSFNGVINSIYEDYKVGGLGTAYLKAESEKEMEVDKGSLLGESATNSSLPNTTTGATMALDTGSVYGAYSTAITYAELLEQLKTAIKDNDFGFVGMKLAYEDESSGSLIGYPQSVVEHFTKYMSDNDGKREIFFANIADSDTYMAKNGSAILVKLPILKFTINMGYDNTNVSISGFSDQKMDSGQSAVVSPLLPCMYTITVTTDEGSQSSEVECDMSEGNLQVNIGVTN